MARSVRAKLEAAEPQREVEWVIEDGLVAQADPRLLDVVLTKVASALDLDKDQRACSGISHPVFGLAWNERFLIRPQPDLAFPQCDYRIADNDHPVFAAALMHLQAKAVTRVHFNALNFVSLAFREHFVGAPRAFVSFDRHSVDDCTPVGGMTSAKVQGQQRAKRKRGWLPIPAFSHREPPFCVAAIYYLFFAPFLAAFFGAAFFLAPPFFAVAILCFSFR